MGNTEFNAADQLYAYAAVSRLKTGIFYFEKSLADLPDSTE